MQLNDVFFFTEQWDLQKRKDKWYLVCCHVCYQESLNPQNILEPDCSSHLNTNLFIFIISSHFLNDVLNETLPAESTSFKPV